MSTQIPPVRLVNTIQDGGEGQGDVTQVSFVEVHPQAIELGFEGYGECGAADGYGRPVRVELYEGKLRLLVWADINSEDPTHTIELNGAQEVRRE